MRILAFLLALLPALAAAPPAGADVRVTSRTYDLLDRLETETVALEDGGTATVSYTYYNDGRRRTVTDAFGRVTFYEYDGRGNLKRLTANQGLPDEQVTSYEYWPDNLLRTITRPNGTVTSYEYDRADRLRSVVVRRDAIVVLSHEYTYDANGNRLTQVETNGGAPETTTYTYDALNRLETVTYPDASSAAYEYDAVGNRIGETLRSPSGEVVSDKTASFDAINRLASITDPVDPAGSATLAWDRNGNLLSKTTPAGTESYSYDTRDQLVESRTGTSVSAHFAYDPFGRRYYKLGQASTIRQYVYDETSTLHELDEQDLEVAKYEYGADRLESFFRRDEARRFYHLDGLGSPVALSDSSGSMVARYHLDAWGRYRTPSELSASANRFGFTGYLFDQETDLYYAKARFYDPEIGRFTTQDSVLGQVDEPPSLNRYAYGYSNPLRFLDPTGHLAQDANSAIAEGVKRSLEADFKVAEVRRYAAQASKAIDVPDGHIPEESWLAWASRHYRYARQFAQDITREVFGSAIQPQARPTATFDAEQRAALPADPHVNIAAGVDQVAEDVGYEGGGVAFDAARDYAIGKGAEFAVVAAGRGASRARQAIARSADDAIEDAGRLQARGTPERALPGKHGVDPLDPKPGSFGFEGSSNRAEDLVAWVDEGGNLRAGGSPGMRPDAYRYQSGAPGTRSNLATGRGQAPYLAFTDEAGNVVGAKFDGVRGVELVDRKLNPVFTSKAADQAARQTAVARHYGLTAVWELPTQEAADAANRFLRGNNIEGISVRLAPR